MLDARTCPKALCDKDEKTCYLVGGPHLLSATTSHRPAWGYLGPGVGIHRLLAAGCDTPCRTAGDGAVARMGDGAVEPAAGRLVATVGC